jgi:hypothetical protein
MRLTVRNEQMEVMAAVAEAGFERDIAAHIRESYADSVVKLPDGGELTVRELLPDTLESLVRTGIAKARDYEMKIRSSIATFVALMFAVSPNYDEHRLCGVLLGDEEKEPDDRIGEVLNVLSEKNWEAIRKDYDPNAWLRPAEEPAEKSSEAEPSSVAGASTAGKDPMDKTMSATVSNSRGRKRDPAGQPATPAADPGIDQDTVKIDRIK